MREDIIDWIRAEYGCAASVGIYRKIEQWEDWWRGKCRGFHEYWENSVSGGPIRRELYSLRMAKKICEDWAALLLNDRTYFRASGAIILWSVRLRAVRGHVSCACGMPWSARVVNFCRGRGWRCGLTLSPAGTSFRSRFPAGASWRRRLYRSCAIAGRTIYM